MFGNKYNMTPDENALFAKRNIVDSIWKEAHLEGIAVTFPQTNEIYEGRTVSGLTIKDTMVINNLKHAWFFVLDNLGADIDIRFVLEVNRLVGDNNVVLDAGRLRDYDVAIGGTKWIPEIPTADQVIETLKVIMALKNPVERGLRLFCEICRGQWFTDGNKRTAQLVANASLINEGCGVLSIATEDQQSAMELLIEYYETGNYSSLEKFLYDRALEGIVYPNR